MSKTEASSTSTPTNTQATSLSTLPALYAFDSRSTTWQSYRDRVMFYFMANQVTKVEHQKAMFLWSVGDTTYNLLESLISPRSLTDVTTTYADIIKLLDGHFDDKKNMMTSTYDFYSCTQKAGQTFAEWKAELCDKLRHCGFTKSQLANKPQDRALRDMYVIGIRNQKIRQALLKEQDPDLETTERIIQVAERLQDDVRHFESSRPHDETTVAKIHRDRSKPQQYKEKQLIKASKTDYHQSCGTCGSDQHPRQKCKYREYTCNFCKRQGHLERVCRQRKDDKGTTKHVTTIFKLDDVRQSQSRKCTSPLVPLQINGQQFCFELDTGSMMTIISTKDWEKIGSPSIRQSNYQLKCYSGRMLPVKGECVVTVQYKDQTCSLPMIIVHGNSVPLLGLQWITDLKLDVNSILHGSILTSHHVDQTCNPPKLKTILDKYQMVLNNDLGHCTKVMAHIQLKPTAVPKFFKPRSIPFAYIDGVKEEIQRNVTAGILEKLDTSEWAAPIVPVKKPNGKIRICGDFKVTINPQICIDQHPIPSVDELLTHLNNGQKFTKLDLSDAYLQIELDDESKKLVVINTPLGLFKYNRMPFGISNAPAIFQRIMDQVLAGIPNCVAYLDDILITGTTDEEHLQTLEAVLSKFQDFNLRCNPSKCSFFNDQVCYLGFIIDKNGKRPDPQRVQAIQNMPSPTNVREVEAFIGKINYYGKFISNFSHKCATLNHLRRQDIVWHWDTKCQAAFDDLKNEICQATTLAHFDGKLPIILCTDASNYGIGAVLMHRYRDGSERPIAHASKTLTPAETRYSQIEKEALSIIYGIKKFHQYLAGRNFELVTDHQPLLSIFHPGKGIPTTTANRLQRWALCLMAYTYTIRYKPTKRHANADALSRLPAGPDTSFVDTEASQVNLIQADLVRKWPVQSNEIEKATENDGILRLVKQFTLTKWPGSLPNQKKHHLLPYYNSRHGLSVFQGCLIRDTQVIIPEQLRRRVLQMLHEEHLGIVKMKQLARTYCWWPNIDKHIMDLIRSCSICSKLQTMPKAEFKEWSQPEQVWSRVHADFAGPIWGSKWLIMIDAKSKFPFIADMGNDTTAENVSNALEKTFDLFGPPEILVTDNGPPFNSFAMEKFYKYYGIKHVNTPPYHPSSNGIAERFVRSFKDGIRKEQQTGQTDKHEAVRNILRSYRWTPHTTTGCLPANMMFQHSIRTALHRLRPTSSTSSTPMTPKFHVGQVILTRDNPSQFHQKWEPAIVTQNLGTMLYLVQRPDGKILKRHQNQLHLSYGSKHRSVIEESLPDDLVEPKQSTLHKAPVDSTPRYPRRQRKPPQRYSPS